MKLHTNYSRTDGMTLIEILVVISIIALLAGMIVPAVGRAKVKASIAKARVEMNDIKGAISAYRADYSLLPASPTASATSRDQIYGTAGVIGYSGPAVVNGSGYEESNGELMLILTASSTNQFPGANNAVNENNARNTKKTAYLNAKQNSSIGRGLGYDAVYRDPWGQPYIVTLDLNYDDYVQPAIYRLDAVGQQSGPTGFYGTTRQGAGVNNWAVRESVVVWSMGPDKAFASSLKANSSGIVNSKKVDNSDNVVSWQAK
jgi:prepilin-type N-terminal cleavage/methylation domain-containing protein